MFCWNFVEYESNGDKSKNVSLSHCLNETYAYVFGFADKKKKITICVQIRFLFKLCLNLLKTLIKEQRMCIKNTIIILNSGKAEKDLFEFLYNFHSKLSIKYNWKNERWRPYIDMFYYTSHKVTLMITHAKIWNYSTETWLFTFFEECISEK